MFFTYGETQTDYLKRKDKKLGALIDAIGPIERTVDPDLFSSVVHQIAGQQISNKALCTIWNRMREALGSVTAASITAAEPVLLHSLGLSSRKVAYIQEFAARVQSGSFDLEGIRELSDEDAIEKLTTLRGVGVWTAEMILLFCLQRPDILSYDDLGIRKGLCMVYHHRRITRELFEKYRRRYHPYGSVASLYLWAAAQGKTPDR